MPVSRSATRRLPARRAHMHRRQFERHGAALLLNARLNKLDQGADPRWEPGERAL